MQTTAHQPVAARMRSPALCRSVPVAGTAAPECTCRNSYSGAFCSTAPECNGTLFYTGEGTSACCASGRFVSAAGSCCPLGSTLDEYGACCAVGELDACGTCNGGGVGRDRTGECCTGFLTEDLLCCPQPLDRCGACGDGTSCNTELVLLLSGVTGAVEATIMDTTRSLLCAHFGYGSTEASCPMSVSPGSRVLPASRQLRLREKQRGTWAVAWEHGHGSAGVQAADVGIRVLRAWASARGAAAVPAAAMAPPGLWAHQEATASRGLLDSSTGDADLLELSVRLPCMLGFTAFRPSCLRRQHKYQE